MHADAPMSVHSNCDKIFSCKTHGRSVKLGVSSEPPPAPSVVICWTVGVASSSPDVRVRVCAVCVCVASRAVTVFNAMKFFSFFFVVVYTWYSVFIF